MSTINIVSFSFFAWDLYCCMGFKAHLLSHQHVVLFACHICGRAFTDPHKLTTHSGCTDFARFSAFNFFGRQVTSLVLQFCSIPSILGHIAQRSNRGGVRSVRLSCGFSLKKFAFEWGVGYGPSNRTEFGPNFGTYCLEFYGEAVLGYFRLWLIIDP